MNDFATLQQLEIRIAAAQKRVSETENERSNSSKLYRVLSKTIMRLRFRERIRKPAETYVLWCVGLLVVGIALSAVSAFLLLSILSAPTFTCLVCTGIAAVVAGTVLFRWLYVPDDQNLIAAIIQFEHSFREVAAQLKQLGDEQRAILTELSGLNVERSRLVNSHRVRGEQLLTSNWKAMRDAEWEQFLAAIFRLLGAEVTETGTSGDQGVDLVVDFHGVRTAIQAKGYYHAVGNAAVQQAVAGKAMYRCQRSAVITNSKFTKSAIELAAINSCLLIAEDKIRALALGEMTSLFQSHPSAAVT